MPHSLFLLPFRETKREKKLSSTALLMAVVLTVVLILLADKLLNVLLVYLVSFFFFLMMKASFYKTLKLIGAAAVVIFFLGIPSLFLQKGIIIFILRLGKNSISFYSEGVWRAIFIWVRGISSVSIITLFSTCVTMQEFVQSLRSLFVPNIMATIILMILRYAPMFLEEGEEIRVAQKLRGIDLAPRKRRFKATAALVGSTLIKSIRKGGETYEAMVLRGLESEQLLRREKITFWDPIVLLILTIISSLLSGGIVQCIMK
ncbi:MAG: energy-coupling factor transporter transmembrane component T family protein [Candidatus Heimdallarchaeaceae archaeon]